MAGQQATPPADGDENNSTHTMTASTKFAFKTCPWFDPNFYLVWANDVHLAFEERDWDAYLLPSDPESAFKPDPRTAIKAKAFLMEAIPYEHKVSMTTLTSAAAIFKSLEEQYGTTSREDEHRFERQLMFMRKPATDSVDEHIAKFKSLIASTMAHQEENHRYRNDKRNSLFLATLEYSNIEDEKWENFIPFLGNTWQNMTPESLFAATRTYYLAHILPKKNTSTSETYSSVEARVQRMDTNQSGNPRGWGDRFNNFNNRSNYGNPNYGNNSGSNDKHREKSDPSKFCHFHNAPGHSTEACHAKYQDPAYMKFLNSSSNSNY
jgi:hypothetical protein